MEGRVLLVETAGRTAVQNEGMDATTRGGDGSALQARGAPRMGQRQGSRTRTRRSVSRGRQSGKSQDHTLHR